MILCERIFSLPLKWHIAILMLLVGGVFGATINNGFVWDDTLLIVANPAYQNADFKTIFTGLANGLEYLPIRDLTFILDYRLWGWAPMGWHATNLIIYAALVITVYFTSKGIFHAFNRNQSPCAEPDTIGNTFAFVVALLYAVHPLNVQSVAFVTQRNTLLAGLFTFASTALFLRFIRTSGGAASLAYILSLLMYILALFSKAIAIPLPLLFLAFAITLKGREQKWRLAGVIPFMITAGACSVLFQNIARSTKMVNELNMQFGGGTLVSRLCVATQIPFFYIAKFLLPINLSPEYNIQFSRNFASVTAIAAMSGLLLTLVVILMAARKFPLMAVGGAWYFVMLLPVLNLIPSYPTVADRYTFLPLYGLCLVSAWGLLSLMKRFRTAGVCCTVLLVMLSALCAYMLTKIWHSGESLWLYAQKQDPRSSYISSQLGAYYESVGEYAKARQQYARFEKISPGDNTLTLFDAGEAFRKKDFRNAVELYRLIPDISTIPNALYNLGQSYEALGQPAEAMTTYLAIIKYPGADPNNLSRNKAKKRLETLEIPYLSELARMRDDVSRNPADWKARFVYAIQLDTLGKFDEALEQYTTVAATSGGGGEWRVWHNLGNVQLYKNTYVEAVASFEKSISLYPSSPDTWNNLCGTLRRAGKIAASRDCYRKTVSLFPDFALAHYGLGATLCQMGDKEGAIAQLRHIKERFPSLAQMARELEDSIIRER